MNIYCVIFFPTKHSLFFFYPLNNGHLFGNNFLAEYKENNSNISRITKKVIKKTYKKDNYPIVLFNPFLKEDKFFENVHVGYVHKEEID